jgi:MFS transporter, DHA1 family, multidrug resistance protein
MVGMRFLLGAVAGNQTAIAALVSAEAPAPRIGRALGIIGATTALGRALSPILAGFLAVYLGLREQFIVAGVVMFLAALPLSSFVRETDRRREPSRRLSLRQLWGALPTPTRNALGIAITALSTVNALNFATLQFLELRLLEVAGGRAALFTGFTFAVIGGGTAVGALATGRLVEWLGYRWVATVAAGLLGVTIVAIALTNAPALIVLEACGYGIMTGCSLPTLNSLIGLESPEPMRATAYGAANSMIGVLMIVLPAVSGLLAARFDTPAALLTGAVASLLISGLLVLTREPAAVP